MQILRDIRYSVRALLRTPVIFAAAVLTLAVGTGLATGVVAVAYGLLLRPMPYPDPDRLVAIMIHASGDPNREIGLRLSEVEEWRSRMRAFDRVAAHSSGEFTLRGAGDPRSVRAAMVTEGFFETVGMKASEGSTASISDAPTVVALSSRLRDQIGRGGSWRERGLTLGTGSFSVAAIMPPAFAVPSDLVDLWVRADAVPEVRLFSMQDLRWFQLIGRLRADVTLDQAKEDVRRVSMEMEGRKEDTLRRDAIVRPLNERSKRDARATVIPFLAGAAFVLLIACANVSGLLVGRAVSREHEFAVRRALGGSMRQILSASLVESGFVALCGWALGLGLAYVVVQVFETLAAGTLSNLQRVRIDVPILLISLGLAALVTLLSGGAPAIRSAKADPNGALKQTSERAGRAGSAIRTVLVAGQIALTVVLLICAGLLMRTVERIVGAERGFTTDNGISMRLRLTQETRFAVTEREPFIERLVTETRSLPGVVAAGVGSDVPPNVTQLQLTIRVVRNEGSEMIWLLPVAVTPGYLEALGVTIVRGRLFEERDRLAPVPRVVISETAARQLFRDRDPVGLEWPTLLPGPPGKRVKPLVIGVVRDIKHRGLDQAAPGVMYAPWERLAPTNAHLVVRTTSDPAKVAPALRRIVQNLDPTLPLFTPQTLDEVVAGSIAPRRLRLQLAATFAGLALALAVVALWGAMAQTVLDRRRELAVRLALGATSAAAVRLTLRGGLVLIAFGAAIGAAGGALTGRMIEHLLHGVTPLDPVAFGCAVAVAIAISGVACYVPARRAAAISPAELLRQN